MTLPAGALVRLTEPQSLREEWTALARVANPSFFLSWGWMGPWADAIVEHTPLYLWRHARAGQTIALALLSTDRVVRRRGLVRSVQVQLNEHTAPGCDMIIEHNGLLCRPDDVAESWHAFGEALQQAPFAWDELKLRSLIPEQLTAARHAFADLRTELDRELPSWVVRLGETQATIDGLLAVFKKKIRQQLRQSLREFESLGPLGLHVASDGTQAAAFFAEMESFHAERWARVGKRGSFANRLWANFHASVIAGGVERGDVIVARASVGEDSVGFVYGFVARGRFYALQTGFKPQPRTALRSGYVTHFLLMRALAERGVQVYDFLPDEERSYKRLLAEPGELLTTLRLQRPRLKFRLERAAVALHEHLRRPRPDTAETTTEHDDV